MMRRTRLFCVCALALVGVLLAASVGSADTRWNNKAERLYKSIENLANKIVANNKPTSQPKEILDFGDGWSMEWNKNGTKVIGLSSERNGKFEPREFETTDPKMVFAGNVHVGASTKILTDFLGLSIKRLDPNNSGKIDIVKGDIDMPEHGLIIKHKNGKIISIRAWFWFLD